MKRSNVALAVILLCAAVTACRKDDAEKKEKRIVTYGEVKPEILESEKVVYDRSFNLSVPDTVLFDSPKFKAKSTFPHVQVDGFIDLHMEMFPIYAFGSSNTSGDYYAVSGYVVAHNAEAFSTGRMEKDSGWIESDEVYGKGDYLDYASWFMSRMNIDFQLLTEDGSPVSNDKVTFFVTPEPSTTIGERTYTKGFSFSLLPAITVGTAKIDTEGAAPSWAKTKLGCVGIGLNWNNSSTQLLPDQTFEMSTDPYDRTVFYIQQTNNITTSMDEDCAPAVARNDERFDFSWVWHVAPGEYSAQDYGFGKMNMKVTVHPELMGNFKGMITLTVVDKDDPEKVDYDFCHYDAKNLKFQCPSGEEILPIPAINRIPVGNVEFKNTTRNYVTDIRIFRNGEKDVAAEAYSTIDGYYDTNESVEFILREGRYDMVYNIKNGDTGEVIGSFIIEDFEVSRDGLRKISTMDGKRIDSL